MRKVILVVAVLLLTGCSIFRPRMPKDLKPLAADLLKECSVLNAMTSQGVSFMEYANQLAKTRGAYDLALSEWPDKYAPSTKEYFDKAFTGWSLALQLWNDKIQEYDNPTEPDINGYQKYIDYAGDDLVIETRSNDYLVEDYRGKKFVTFDNIGLLLGRASDDYLVAQTVLQNDL